MLTRIRDLLYKDGFTIKGAKLLKSKEALLSTGAVAEAVAGSDTSDLAAIRAILESARKRAPASKLITFLEAI